MQTALIINASTTMFALLTTVMLLIATGLDGSLRQPVNRWFFITVLINLIVVLLETSIYLMEGSTAPYISGILRVMDFLDYVAGSLQFLAFSIYIYAYLSTKKRMSKALPYTIGCLSIIAIVLALIAQFNQMYAAFDATNAYQQQPSFWISEICPTLSMIVYTLTVVRNFKVLRLREKLSLLMYTVIAIVCYVQETLIAELWLSHVGGTLCLFIIYINIQVDLKQQAKAREMELTESRIAVMLGQIQPHFLFNSLTAIAKLCDGHPQAQQALITFSEYLRMNMDSLTQKTPVPFEKELEHTRQYLWLEQLRFGDRLQVVYDIQTDLFMLPVLTLQPIVENAVRYGVTKKRSGGTVTIRTEEDARGIRITVTDDGAGFDPMATANDGRSHTGISGVKNRLEALCGGQLTLQSEMGKGTTVIIEIPKEKGSKHAYYSGR